MDFSNNRINISEHTSYYPRNFFSDLKMIKLERPVFESMDPTRNRYFGFECWGNCHVDLAQIDDKELFVLYLFLSVVTDLTMHCYFFRTYRIYRRKTMMLKFGSELSKSRTYQQPFYLFHTPLKRGLISQERLMKLVPKFVSNWIRESQKFHTNIMPSIDYREFFMAIINDQQFLEHYNHNEVYKLIFDEIKLQLS